MHAIERNLHVGVSGYIHLVDKSINELPRGKLQSIRAKTTGVARNDTDCIQLPWRTPLSDIWQDMKNDIARQKHCGFYECINSCHYNTITQLSQQAAGNQTLKEIKF